MSRGQRDFGQTLAASRVTRPHPARVNRPCHPMRVMSPHPAARIASSHAHRRGPRALRRRARRDALADQGRRQRRAQADRSPSRASARPIEALGMDPLDAQVRLVYFFDTPDLALDERRRRARAARRSARATTPWSSCARSFPPTCPPSCATSPDFVVEVDAMPGGYVCSASLKGVPARRRCARSQRGERRCASCSPRSSARSTPSTRPRASRSTTSRCSGRSSCSSSRPRRPASRARWSSSCGCTPTARASSSCRPSALPREAFQVAAEARAFLAERGIETDRRADDQDAQGARVLLRAAAAGLKEWCVHPAADLPAAVTTPRERRHDRHHGRRSPVAIEP